MIIGRLPQPGQAHGLSFSVPRGTNARAANIYEMAVTLRLHRGARRSYRMGTTRCAATQHSANRSCAQLTSHQNQAGATDHSNIQELNQRRQNLVFVLWGSRARSKQKLIDQRRHLIITSAHPSPLSAYRGFFGSKPFSKCNAYLQRNDKLEIDWSLSD